MRNLFGKLSIGCFFCAFSALIFTTCFLEGDIESLRPQMFTVTFDSNGGSPVPPPQLIISGNTASWPTDPELDGFSLNGWYSDPELTKIYDFSAPVTGDITLYAKWMGLPDGVWMVIFNSSGGDHVSTQLVSKDSTATRPADPTRSGYTFANWYRDPGLTTMYNFSTPVTGNITLYAGWNEIRYTVTFDSKGGTPVPSQSVIEGNTAS